MPPRQKGIRRQVALCWPSLDFFHLKAGVVLCISRAKPDSCNHHPHKVEGCVFSELLIQFLNAKRDNAFEINLICFGLVSITEPSQPVLPQQSNPLSKTDSNFRTQRVLLHIQDTATPCTRATETSCIQMSLNPSWPVLVLIKWIARAAARFEHDILVWRPPKQLASSGIMVRQGNRKRESRFVDPGNECSSAEQAHGVVNHVHILRKAECCGPGWHERRSARWLSPLKSAVRSERQTIRATTSGKFCQKEPPQQPSRLSISPW
ncbi:hypothetical protein F5B21DRAFT_16815 [Xylaria acuta]|nr:hypothetical protein F5B21DRAFT_16815 [Xylaria acuta]